MLNLFLWSGPDAIVKTRKPMQNLGHTWIVYKPGIKPCLTWMKRDLDNPIWFWPSNTHTCMHACTHAHAHTRAYTHMRTHTHSHTHTHTHTYTHTHTHTHTHTYTCPHTYSYIQYLWYLKSSYLHNHRSYLRPYTIRPLFCDFMFFIGYPLLFLLICLVHQFC